MRSLHAYSDKCIGPALRDLVFEKRAKLPREWDQSLINASEAAWRDCQAWLEQALEPQWLNGCRLSAGECALAARCGVAEAYGVAVSADYPKLYEWFQSVKWRPAWDAAYPKSFPAKDPQLITI